MNFLNDKNRVLRRIKLKIITICGKVKFLILRILDLKKRIVKF